MASITKAGIDNALRVEYTTPQVLDIGYTENTWYGMIEKMRLENASKLDFTVKSTRAQNRSATAATALNKTHTPVFHRFQVPPVGDYDADSITREAIKAATSDEEAIDIAMDTVDGIIQNLSNEAGRDAFGNVGGARGRLGTNGSYAVTSVVLANPEDSVFFEVGMVIKASLTDGTSGVLRAGSVTLTAVDRDTGTLTASGNWDAGITSPANADYLFQDGDFGTKRAGFDSWCPSSTAGLGTAFYGATRSGDPTRLAGQRVSATGLPLLEAIRKGASRAGREGWYPEYALCGHDVYNRICTELGNKAPESYVRVAADGEATVSYTGVRVSGGKGTITVIPDRNCPDDVIYETRKEAWKCIYYGKTPVEIDDDDGNILARETSTFSYDVRGSAFLNFAARNPQMNCRIAVATS